MSQLEDIIVATIVGLAVWSVIARFLPRKRVDGAACGGGCAKCVVHSAD